MESTETQKRDPTTTEGISSSGTEEGQQHVMINKRETDVHVTETEAVTVLELADIVGVSDLSDHTVTIPKEFSSADKEDTDTSVKKKSKLKRADSIYDSAPKTPTVIWLKKHGMKVFVATLIFQILFTSILFVSSVMKERDDSEWFWYGLAIKNGVLFSSQYVLGQGVLHRGWKVGYTRKVVHVTYYLLPFLLDVYLPVPEEDSWLWALWNVCIVLWFLLFITKPIRKRFKIVQIFYASVDRPEDRGLTQIYTVIQVPLSVIIIAGFAILFTYKWDKAEWTLCPIIAVTFGDGLAEPVARFWDDFKICGGTHKYRTRGLFAGDRLFTRSIEGSAIVFIFSVLAVFLIYDELEDAQLLFLLLVLPLTMTLLEMVAPHSMDNPFLLAWGYFLMFVAYFIKEGQGV
eukprot:g1140.t1